MSPQVGLLCTIVATLLSGSRVSAESPDENRSAPPSWAADARWYYVVVPRFRNGDTTNDPDETLPWTADWPVEGDTADAIEVRKRRYGGDLQGVMQRLGYFKELGVNALCLSPVFHGEALAPSRSADLRHVDRAIAVKGGLSELNGESSDPATWKWSPSDRLFLELIDQAHKEGLRVVVGGLLGTFGDPGANLDEIGPYIFQITRRWMDPNADGDPSDGVDGWIHAFEETALGLPGPTDRAARRRLYEHIKKLNPNALLIASSPLAVAQVKQGLYDVAIDFELGRTITTFFHPAGAPEGKSFFASLAATNAGNVNLTMLSANGTARLLTALSRTTPPPAAERHDTPGPRPTDDAVDRWRLAVVFQHFFAGAPATFYGDEVGLHGGSGPFASAPMPWEDSPASAGKPPGSREDFRALVQWLHRTREKYAPLRSGVVRPVLFDDERKILAFARTLPGDEAILVMNYGNSKQEVSLPAGRPGQLVTLLSPQIKPPAPGGKPHPPSKDPTRRKQLQVGGSKQFVNQDGHVSLWVGAMSARVILVTDAAP